MSEVNGLIDLHTHTTCSDGFLNPYELIDRAAANAVKTLAITDHDTVDAYTIDGVQEHARNNGIRLIPGIEFSATEADGSRAHILGLGIDIASPALLETIQMQDSARSLYASEVCKMLQELGWRTHIEKLREDSNVITKAHIARSVISDPLNSTRLIAQFNGLPTAGAFIEATMIKTKPAYIPVKHQLTTKNAVTAIHQAGGAAVFAHPVAHLYESQTSLEQLEKQIKQSGVDGVEAYYLYYAKRQGDIKVDKIADMATIAKQLGLFVTGGSDFHGDNPSVGNFVELGLSGERVRVPEESLEFIAETRRNLAPEL